MLPVVMVAIGGALGAVARYLTYIWVRAQSTHYFPIGTLLINVAGCFAIGVLMVFVEKSVPFHRHLLLIGATGFLGSYTTFSTFGFETIHLIRNDHFGWAGANILANVVLGLVGVWMGRFLTEQWVR